MPGAPGGRRWWHDRASRNGNAAARHAIPYFSDPYPDRMMEALPGCVGPDRPAKRPLIPFGDDIIRLARKNYVHQQKEAAA
jgi:isopenicillin N synthase-like dioxygenase